VNESRSSEADERFATRLGEEIRAVLGPSITLDVVAVGGHGPVSLVATCLVNGEPRDITGEGATLLEASRNLINAAAELRLADAWTRLEASSRG
jgi:hypothetical protein